MADRGRRAPRLAAAWLWAGAAILAAMPAPAAAYIDPGTGSALVYVVTGIVVSVFFALRGLSYRVAEWGLRARSKVQRCNLAIHSEHPRYESTFLPVLRALAARGVEVTYFTMYDRSEGFEPLPPSVIHRAIPEGMVGYAYLNHLDAKMLVTTTPQLDVMTFRRSKRVGHYCIIQHALGESRYVKPYAYDYFDSVLCCGPVLEANLRKMEKIRRAPPKRLLRTGLPHYDELARAASEHHGARASRRPGARSTILVAPSWGALSLFQRFGTGFVRPLATQYDVIVRPHPQMKYSQPALYQEILALPGVEVDVGDTPAPAMARADALVSDISGIMHEFAFIYARPVIVVDHAEDVGGLEGAVLGGGSDLRVACSAFIVSIPETEVGNLAAHVKTALDPAMPARIAEAREQLVYNFGRAGEVAAGQIEEILRCQ